MSWKSFHYRGGQDYSLSDAPYLSARYWFFIKLIGMLWGRMWPSLLYPFLIKKGNQLLLIKLCLFWFLNARDLDILVKSDILTYAMWFLKIITKAITNRHIIDNALVAFEVFHFIKKKAKGRKRYMALNVDMTNAYDRVEWAFIEYVLKHIGCLLKFISLVMKCVTTISFSVLLNGYPFKDFKP